ncbi:hypothetical protein GTP46_29165 [Duganella sp. FT135W]|uniref:Uncharacterized protein n=1 Tax=Duganella flavida TaxID=2692175 RepID=A0A6L8KIX5_9BURK|nr:hypothetical protein [Duganella flavida]MYM26687.1 hypothetical protein [Duganella flavida]
MFPSVSIKELNTLQLMESLGRDYQPIFPEAGILAALGLVKRDLGGSFCLTASGLDYLRWREINLPR